MRLSRIIIAACVAGIALPGALAAQMPNADPIRVGGVAEKLGVKLMPNAPIEVELGHSVTAMLSDPKKIETVGIKGMHEGARVTITCVGPNRLRVEADEMEPVAQRSVSTVHVGTDGSLTPASDRPASPPAPPKPPTK